MPENGQNEGLVVVMNGRFKNRLVIALCCLVYALDYLCAQAGQGAFLPYFLFSSAGLALLFFVLYACTWITRPGKGWVRILAWVSAGAITFHLLGSYAVTLAPAPAVILIFFVILVNLLSEGLTELLVYNPLVAALAGFLFLVRDRFVQNVQEASAPTAFPPLVFWLNILVSSLVMLLIRIYRKEDQRQAEIPSEEKKPATGQSIEAESPMATLVINATTGLIVRCNQSAVRFFDGYSEQDLLGKDLHHFQETPWTTDEQQQIRRTLGRRGKVAVSTRFLTLKDRVVPASWTIHSSAPATGEYLVTVTESADLVATPAQPVAGAPAVAAAPFTSELPINAILENSGYAIVSVDRQHIIQVVNATLANGLYELTGGRVIAGLNLRSLIPSAFLAKYDEAFARALRGISSVLEERLELPAGRNLDAEINVNPLYSATGQVMGVSFFGKNISERKRSEMELVHAREQALAEVRAKSAFLATMSHEIRTPLNGVIGMSKLLEHTSLNAKQREYVGSLVLSGEALLSVINDILDYSRMESTKLELEHKPFAVKRCVEETFDLLTAKAAEKNLRLLYTMSRSVPTFIYGDITRLRQVLLNLVSNAIKFTARGSVTIETTAHILSGNRYELQFEVRDTGIGIPADRIASLFQPYVQAGTDTARKFGGTGLGLAISKNLVELMGGRIRVESSEGHGSSFIFTLQADKADSKELILGNAHAAKQLVNAQALIISDEKKEYMFFAEYFTRWGMQTVCTDDAGELMKLLEQKGSYQVLAIDARMITAKPRDLAAKARSLRPDGELSIVLFNADDNDRMSFDYSGDVVSAIIPADMDRSKILNVLLGIFSEESLRGRQESQVQKLDRRFAEALPLRILVAEDNAVSRKLASAIFEGLGYTIDLAENGREAVERIAQSNYDIVFMDVQMPEMDGFEATRYVLEKMRPVHPPIIIAMTAFALEGDREKCLEAGMKDYISKPILIEEITDKLQRWGAGKKPEKQGVPKAEPVEGLLDMNVIARLKELNERVEKGFFAEVVTMFLKQAPSVINEMIIYCNDKRYDKMGQAAHKLKGSSLNIGAKAMAALCREIEIRGRNNDGTDCSASLEKLRGIYAETEATLRSLAS